MWAKQKQSGFTIVELLIVIVVIAILAAITITAYNGIQQRARNSQVIAGANAYVKAFTQYKAVNSTYPTVSGCLGANYPSNVCWMDGASTNMGVNGSLDSVLQEFIPTKPTLATSLMPIGIGNLSRAGLVFLYNDGMYGNRLAYYLTGINQNCSISGASPVNEGGLVTQCNISLP